MRKRPASRLAGDNSPFSRHMQMDFASISQRHRTMQSLAIASLPAYAAQSDAFVVVAPTTTHTDLDTPCDFASYSVRGWCRAEVMSKVCGSGLLNMFISSERGFRPVTMDDPILRDLSLFDVYSGDFTCCTKEWDKPVAVCDKEKLVKPMLGLWGLILQNRKKPLIRPIFEKVLRAQTAFFPTELEFRHKGLASETKELFGTLVCKMEAYVNGGESALVETSTDQAISRQLSLLHGDSVLRLRLTPQPTQYHVLGAQHGSTD